MVQFQVVDLFCHFLQIGSLEGFYLLEHERVHKRSADPSVHHHEKLVNEPGVIMIVV